MKFIPLRATTRTAACLASKPQRQSGQQFAQHYSSRYTRYTLRLLCIAVDSLCYPVSSLARYRLLRERARFRLAARSLDERYRRFAFEPRQDFHSAFPGVSERCYSVGGWVGGGGDGTGACMVLEIVDIFLYNYTHNRAWRPAAHRRTRAARDPARSHDPHGALFS